MFAFILEHLGLLGAIAQVVVTFWMASIARNFQITLAVYGRRMETHREAVKRGFDLMWLKKEDPGWEATMNETNNWLLIDEVYLTPAAAQAFRDIYLYKSLQGSDALNGPAHFKKAQAGQDALRKELLRFRKRPLSTLVADGFRWVVARFRKPKQV